ncbi:MAG: hypothetical protein PVH41_06630 [Anaerolineae bacterium]|jgi:hypothetical protein
MVDSGGGSRTSDEQLEQAYDVFVDDRGLLNLVSLEVVGDPAANTRLAELIRQDIVAILETDPDIKHRMVVDLLPLGNAGYASRNARRTYLEISSNPQIGEFAVVGGSVTVRTLARFFIRAAGKGEHMRWFEDKEGALAWLAEAGGDG